MAPQNLFTANYILLFIDLIIFNMTLQFRQKSQVPSLDELQNQVKLLRDYNGALQKQNNSRNQERKILHAELDRLMQIQREWKNSNTVGSISGTQSKEYLLISSKYDQISAKFNDLKLKYESLVIQNSSLTSKINSSQSRLILLSSFQRQKTTLLETNRNFQIKIHTLQTQIFNYQSQINELKRSQQSSNSFNQSNINFRLKLDELQRQKNAKSSEIIQIQQTFKLKQESLNREILLLQSNIQRLERQLRDKDDEQFQLQKKKDDGDLRQIMSLQIKIDEFERQLSIKQQQSLRLNKEITTKEEYYSKQINIYQKKITDSQITIKAKSEQISKVQAYSLQKDEQLSKLNTDISTYLNKINFLSDELDKLQRAHKAQLTTQTIRYVETEQLSILRSKVEQLNAINISLNNNLSLSHQDSTQKTQYVKDLERRILILQQANRSLQEQLRKYTISNHENAHKSQYIKDLQRRISILEQTNHSLQEQLRKTIESRKNASRIIQAQQQDQSLKQTIISLRNELHQFRMSNQVLKKQNDDIYSQLQSYRTHNHHCHHGAHTNKPKSRSKSPISRKLDSKNSQFKQSDITFHQSTPQYIPNNRMSQTTSPLSSNLYKTSSPAPMVNDRYNQLQRKIKLLQSENQVLKQHLIYQN